MQSTFENLINGNLTDAKRKARHYAGTALIDYAIMELGWSCSKALRAVQYLKDGGSFQRYCDAT
jgi:hypothetical protein